MTIAISDVCEFLERLAPLELAEEWDNVGLLVGRSDRPVQRVMTCLTITPRCLEEAIERDADLIVTHHPMPFRPVNRLTTESYVGRILLTLMESKIAVYSAHTAFDSAADGINQRLAQGLELKQIQPLIPETEDVGASVGAGRFGEFAKRTAVATICQQLKDFLKVEHVRMVGDPTRMLTRCAVACGAAGTFLRPAEEQGCQILITGETNFHTCLEAEAAGVSLILTGHYASERFGIEILSDQLAARFDDLEIWPSAKETNPWKLI